MADNVNVRVHKPTHLKFKKQAARLNKKNPHHPTSTQGLINQVLAEKEF